MAIADQRYTRGYTERRLDQTATDPSTTNPTETRGVNDRGKTINLHRSRQTPALDRGRKRDFPSFTPYT